MNSKSVEYLQQTKILDDTNQNLDDKNSIPLPLIDSNYIILNRGIKYFLNFLLIYLFVTLIIYNFPETNMHLFIILICTISSIVFYILDLTFPSCYV